MKIQAPIVNSRSYFWGTMAMLGLSSLIPLTLNKPIDNSKIYEKRVQQLHQTKGPTLAPFKD